MPVIPGMRKDESGRTVVPGQPWQRKRKVPKTPSQLEKKPGMKACPHHPSNFRKLKIGRLWAKLTWVKMKPYLQVTRAKGLEVWLVQ
jgi:hypothetical protein